MANLQIGKGISFDPEAPASNDVNTRSPDLRTLKMKNLRLAANDSGDDTDFGSPTKEAPKSGVPENSNGSLSFLKLSGLDVMHTCEETPTGHSALLNMQSEDMSEISSALPQSPVNFLAPSSPDCIKSATSK